MQYEVELNDIRSRALEIRSILKKCVAPGIPKERAIEAIEEAFDAAKVAIKTYPAPAPERPVQEHPAPPARASSVRRATTTARPGK